MAVIDPLKVVLTNLPDDFEESLSFPNHPKDDSFGTRSVPFSRELWIEREDFEEVPPKGFKRLTTGGEVRLRGAGIIRCDAVVKDADGRIIELHCTLDPESRPGHGRRQPQDQGHDPLGQCAPRDCRARSACTIACSSFPIPDDGGDGKTYQDHLNPDSRTHRRTATSSPRPRTPRPSNRSSSNASATSSPTATTIAPMRRCSTAA